MKLGRVLLLAALAAVTLAGAAFGKSGDSNQLRTAIVVSQTATGTNTLTAWADPEGSTGGKVREDSLVVIDYIVYSSTAGGADEVWTINVYDDNSVAICPLVAMTVSASAADYMPVYFPTGLPLYNVAALGGAYKTGTTPCSGNYNVSVTGPTASGGLTIGYHMENPRDRAR